MITCYLGLGSNLNCPKRQLIEAIKNLRRLPKSQVTQVAHFYHSRAWGRKGQQPDYCNTVVELKTTLSPLQLLKQCQRIETKQGRYRRVKWGARTLDIDILTYGNRAINIPCLIIPHKYMFERDFVLIPLSELVAVENLLKITTKN